MFHRHTFEDVSTDYIEGVDLDFDGITGPRSFVEGYLDRAKKLVSGYTVIHQRCACGDYRTQEVIGRVGKFRVLT